MFKRRAFVMFSLVCALAAGAQPGAPPATERPQSRPSGTADRWEGVYDRLNAFAGNQPVRSHLSLVKVGDAYRLRGGHYDDFEFIEVKPGLLRDRHGVLGTITRGTLTFEAPQLGAPATRTVLYAQFCYEWFYLFEPPAGAGPATQPATRPAAPEKP